VPTTLLAIDDSVTMRKVLEMTFAGEDFRVVSAESADAAFAKLRSERPSIVICDVTLDGPGGYAVCAKIKSENPAVAVLLLASKQQPYDAHKGQSARADDFIEKPFDTQQLIDKVRRLANRPVETAPPARPTASTGAPMSMGPATQPGVAPVGGGPGRPPPAPVPVRTPGGPPPAPHRPAPGVAGGIGRGTLAYGAYALQNPAAPAAPPQAPAASPGPFGAARQPAAPAAPSPPAATVAPAAATVAPAAAPHGATSAGFASPTAPVGAAAASAAAAASSASNGQLAAKLQHLGLSDAQVSAVLSLSREVIEKVVWEVVPVLAETMIREELKRLTSD
jgi:CheY-like chemotaxis protein